MSKAIVDLPEPETPVMTLNLPRGMLTLKLLRLCSRALMIWMKLSGTHPSTADGGVPVKFIQIINAREHNLRSLSVNIPRGKFSVITGVSGSGKSTIAFDILFNEGQRRYLESLNAY